MRHTGGGADRDRQAVRATRQHEVIRAMLMPVERIASQSEVIRAIVLGLQPMFVCRHAPNQPLHSELILERSGWNVHFGRGARRKAPGGKVRGGERVGDLLGALGLDAEADRHRLKASAQSEVISAI